MRFKLVKFDNGKFGVRVGNWWSGYQFLDIEGRGYAWRSWGHIAEYAMGTEEQARKALINAKLTYHVVQSEGM